MRELSFPPIAQGRTAEILAWEDGYVLKLYREWCPPDWVNYEARVAGAIHAAGIPSPAAGEIVEVNGRRGLIYERLDGRSMLQDMNARPWTLLKHARSLAELHIRIHRQSITGLPSYKDHLRYDILHSPDLKEALRNQLLAILENLPGGENVCHGDFHPGNVLLTKRGPVVIDWMTASLGSPWTDVARTSLLLTIGPKGAGKQVSPLIRMIVRLYHRAYLDRYKAIFPDTDQELDRWAPVIAAARLNEKIIPEREELLRMVKKGAG